MEIENNSTKTQNLSNNAQSSAKKETRKMGKIKLYPRRMINSTLMFLLAWITVFYVFQFFTLLPAYALGAKMIFYSYEIDFNTINVAISNMQLWSDPDNIINIFGSPVVVMTLTVIISITILSRLRPNSLNYRRYLFWTVICGTVRLFGNYISGTLFASTYYVWNWNLVTDFLMITTNTYTKFAAVVVALCINYYMFWMMTNKLHFIFNPFSKERLNLLHSDIILPAAIGCIIVILWQSKIKVTACVCITLMLLSVMLVMCRHFIRRQKMIGLGDEDEVASERIPIFPFIFLILITIGKYFLDKQGGLLLEYSQFKREIFEDSLVVIIGLIVVVIITLTIVSIRKDKKRNSKRILKQQVQNYYYIQESAKPETLEEFGVKTFDNLDKYKQMWDDKPE